MGFFTAFFKMFKDDPAKEIRTRYAEIIIDSINAPRHQRLMEAAGLYHLPAKCKCGFFGKSSNEMEKHFDECEIYSNAIMDLIERRKEKD